MQSWYYGVYVLKTVMVPAFVATFKFKMQIYKYWPDEGL